MRNLILALVCLISFSVQAQDAPNVVATASMIQDIAQNIFGEKLEVQCIVDRGGDPHLHEPTPRDAQMVNKANLILENGLTFEGWLKELIDNSGTKAKTVTVIEGVDIIKSSAYANAADPHAWMNAMNAIVYAKNIMEAAQELMPESKEYFQENFAKYEAGLKETDAFIKKRIAELPEDQRVLITTHDAFQYYGTAYGIKLEAVQGTSTEVEAQTSDVMNIQKTIRESGVGAVFIESTINPKTLKQIAKDTGVKIGGKLYADSLGDKDSPAGTYIGMMKYNTNTIVDALKKGKAEATTSDEEVADTEGGFSIWYYVAIIMVLAAGFLLLRSSSKK